MPRDSHDRKQAELFRPEETTAGVILPEIPGSIAFPIHTRNKAALVAEYLKLFQQVTHHGTYIDGFAGPQAPGDAESWSAHLVLDLEPLWLRHFFLYDVDAEKYAALMALRDAHPDKDVTVRLGDFNLLVDELLASNVIGAREATFSLLDQRTFECQWATVQKLARHKPAPYKIELFYFLAHGWLDRAVRGVTRNVDQLDRWWGGPGWQEFMEHRSGDRPMLFAERFQRELGYAFARAFPIYNAEEGGRTMYYMIHASDHAEAPRFMARAYQDVVRQARPLPQIEIF